MLSKQLILNSKQALLRRPTVRCAISHCSSIDYGVNISLENGYSDFLEKTLEINNIKTIFPSLASNDE